MSPSSTRRRDSYSYDRHWSPMETMTCTNAAHTATVYQMHKPFSAVDSFIIFFIFEVKRKKRGVQQLERVRQIYNLLWNSKRRKKRWSGNRKYRFSLDFWKFRCYKFVCSWSWLYRYVYRRELHGGSGVWVPRVSHSLSSILFDISYIGHRGVQQRGHLLNVLEKIRNERLRSVFAGCLLIFLFSFFF